MPLFIFTTCFTAFITLAHNSYTLLETNSEASQEEFLSANQSAQIIEPMINNIILLDIENVTLSGE